MQLEGKVAVVTGSAMGIGRSFALALAREGARVVIADRAVEEALACGRNVVTEIDVQGGIQIAARMPDSIRIFVLPPDRESLRARLEGRKTEAAQQLARRLEKADGEIATARDSGCYQHFVVNDCLETTVAQVRGIIQKEIGTG